MLWSNIFRLSHWIGNPHAFSGSPFHFLEWVGCICPSVLAKGLISFDDIAKDAGPEITVMKSVFYADFLSI